MSAYGTPAKRALAYGLNLESFSLRKFYSVSPWYSLVLLITKLIEGSENYLDGKKMTEYKLLHHSKNQRINF